MEYINFGHGYIWLYTFSVSLFLSLAHGLVNSFALSLFFLSHLRSPLSLTASLLILIGMQILFDIASVSSDTFKIYAVFRLKRMIKYRYFCRKIHIFHICTWNWMKHLNHFINMFARCLHEFQKYIPTFTCLILSICIWNDHWNSHSISNIF